MNEKTGKKAQSQADPLTLPAELAYELHFLAIAGVQPNLPQNITEDDHEPVRELDVIKVPDRPQAVVQNQ